MDEQNSKLEELPVEPRQGSGNMLAAARKQQQKTIEEIANELNLSVTQIKTIELDQTDGLPEPTYVRGYIRSYAKLLGLKPEEVLHNYLNPDWQKTSNLNDIPRGIGAADESSPAFFTSTRLLMLGLLAVAVITLWSYGMLDGLMSKKDSATKSEIAPKTSDRSADQLPANAATEVAEGVAGNDQVSEAVDSSEAGVAADEPEKASPTENRLVMNFSDTSWVDIRDVNDQRLAYKSYAQGETLEVRESGELRVFIGNADGVSVELNDSPFSLADHREGVYAKFVIDAIQ